jgi:hypothetical protein
MSQAPPITVDARPATDPPPLTAVAMVFAILSLLTWWMPPVGGTLAFVALIMSWIGASSARAHPGRYMATMAPTATRVVAGIALVLAALVLAFWLIIAGLISAISSASATGPGDQVGHGHHHHGITDHAGHEGENEPQLW